VTDPMRVIDAGLARERWRTLLELADEPRPLDAYLQLGDLYGVVNPATGLPRAAVLVVRQSDGTPELRAVAVAEYEQGRGIGSSVVAAVCDRLRAGGSTRVVVGTASSGARQLAFYQRLGFRLTHIEPDFFTTEKGYPAGLSENAIPTRDMVWMARSL
jgi:ribosomal protein S18 acetylase RimI-like enzyme